DPARLLQLCRARLQPRVPRVLRPRTAMGHRGAPRVQRREALTYVVDALVAALLEPRCAACQETLEHPTRGPVCDSCWAEVALMSPPRSRINETSIIERSQAAGMYAGALRHS